MSSARWAWTSAAVWKWGKDVTLDELRAQGYKAFYVAIGCQGGRKAGVPGEDAPNVTTAVDFLHRVNEGEKVELDGRIVVIGGGNVAIDVVRSGLRCGAASADMYCLEARDQMPATPAEIAEAEEDGAVVHCGWGPRKSLSRTAKPREWCSAAVCRYLTARAGLPRSTTITIPSRWNVTMCS